MAFGLIISQNELLFDEISSLGEIVAMASRAFANPRSCFEQFWTGCLRGIESRPAKLLRGGHPPGRRMRRLFRVLRFFGPDVMKCCNATRAIRIKQVTRFAEKSYAVEKSQLAWVSGQSGCAIALYFLWCFGLCSTDVRWRECLQHRVAQQPSDDAGFPGVANTSAEVRLWLPGSIGWTDLD